MNLLLLPMCTSRVYEIFRQTKAATSTNNTPIAASSKIGGLGGRVEVDVDVADEWGCEDVV